MCPSPAGLCSEDRVNPCMGGTCFNRGTKDLSCICPPNRRSYGQFCEEVFEAISTVTVLDRDWRGEEVFEAISTVTVLDRDWRCKDVYTMYGLTLQQFTDMNPGIDCSALLPQDRELVVKEILPACSAFYYTQPADTCSSVAQLLNISKDTFQQLNPGVNCSSRLPVFHSLCAERDPSKAKPKCTKDTVIGKVVDFKQVAVSNKATMVDLCRLNPWISFRDSQRDIDKLCVAATYGPSSFDHIIAFARFFGPPPTRSLLDFRSYAHGPGRHARNNSHADLEACVQKIDLNNLDEEMAEKEPAENSPAKDPSAAENSKEQEGESQEDDIELEGEEDILHAEIAKLQDHAAEQDTRIQQQQSLITNLKRDLSDQDNKIKYLEVELKNMKHDAREQGHQLARQTSKINDLREAFNALRRETMYRPAPRADPPANSASGRTNPSRSGGAVGDPGPSTQRAAEPSTQAFGSLPITLPPFIHGKTDVAAWLSMMTDLFKAHKVQDDARVVAATTVLDQNAQRVVYGSKIQAEADRKPFGSIEDISPLEKILVIHCGGNNSHADLEACVQKIDLNNLDEEMAEKEPAENSPAKDPSAAENSKEQEGESQEDDIELEGEEDILHAEIAKLQDHAAEQDTRIQQQQSLITNLKRDLSDQDNKIKYLEVELKNMKHDAREQGHQLARQTSKINDLREAFNALRRETMYRPAPRADPPANSASGRTNPSRSGGAVGDPGPSTQRAAEPSTQAFGSLPITLPPFIHGKTDVAAWLSMMTDLFKAHKVQDDARVVAATTVLDQNAQRVVYGSKIQAEADRKPFGSIEDISPLEKILVIHCGGNNSHADLEACVQKIDLNNLDEEMAEKEPAENSPAKDPSAAENSKEQEGESQEDDIELEGEEDILHAEIAKLQDHAAEQDTRIQQQQSLITNLKRDLSDQDNKIKYLEVELKNMKHDAREQGHQLARQTSKINDLREAFNALRRETMYRPAPRADPPANSASGRTNPSRSGGAVGDPGPSTQRAAEPSTQAFGSLPITLPPFIHGKTDVAAWLSMMTDLFKAHKVQDDARVVAATTVLDQNAQRVVYGSKIQAEADRKPFGNRRNV
ncbi:unnamed protein product [Closterium sp. Yama58-4]|nr:unnamed protein product [Closterium sp. Yama58-4]